MPTYQTLDNGGHPFAVTVREKCRTVSVACLTWSDDDNDPPVRKECFEAVPKRIFVGKSPFNAMTEYSGGHGRKFDGNSLLLMFEGNRCLHIGANVFGFIARNEIVKYVSPVGNSSVPYPYAVDREGLVYLMVDEVILLNMPKGSEPYPDYYQLSLITPDLSSGKTQRPVFEAFEGITQYFIGKRAYTLRYNPGGAESYDETSRRFHHEPQYIVVDGDNKRLLTRDMYAGIMRRFGAAAGLARLRIREFVRREESCDARGLSRLRRFIRWPDVQQADTEAECQTS